MAKRNEITGALRGAACEIKNLRRVNALLQARLFGIDDALALLFGNPGKQRGEGLMAPCPAAYAETIAAIIEREAAGKKDFKNTQKADSR